MSDDWFTYAQAADRLNLTVEAVRLRALRGRWQKTIGNDKRPRIRLPEGWSNDGQTPVERRERKPRNDGQTTFDRSADAATIKALEAHVETLKAQLSEETDALREYNATLKADVEKLEALLATERERADKAITGFEALLATESERADRAIAAFESLAQRLEAMAAQRAIKPWWQRLLRRAG
jgi:hypothetical protein